MAQPQLNRRLTSLDATFLYYEKKEAPLHVGSTMIFEGEIPFEAFKAMISAKLPLLPRYRQKVVPAPYNVGHPTWEFDEDFDINRHIFHIQLEAPGTMEELRILCEKLQSQLLERNKPLWELYVVDGLEGKRSAIISKVHHAMVDGISGVELMNVSFDLSPNPPPLPKVESVTPTPPRSYSIASRYLDGLFDSAEEAMKSWNLFQKGLLNLTEGLLKETNRTRPTTTSNPLVSLAAPVSPMPFNKPISGQREIAWSAVSFAETKAIRAALGGTVNDVVLTVVSNAIRHYLELRGQKIAGSFLRMMVPVSMRSKDQKGALGNLVSVMPTDIPMDITNPLEFYRYVTKKTTELKEAHVAEEFNLLATLLGTVPPALQALAGSLAPNPPVPIFNIVCTNVPGPQAPLYVLGKQMTESYPYVPIAYTTGLTCAIFSYNQKLFFSFTSATKLMPDLEQGLKPFLEQSFAELREAAGVAQPEIPAASVVAPPVSEEATSTPITPPEIPPADAVEPPKVGTSATPERSLIVIDSPVARKKSGKSAALPLKEKEQVTT